MQLQPVLQPRVLGGEEEQKLVRVVVAVQIPLLEALGCLAHAADVCRWCRGTMMLDSFALRTPTFGDHIDYCLILRLCSEINGFSSELGFGGSTCWDGPKVKEMLSCWEQTPRRALRGFVYESCSPSKQSQLVYQTLHKQNGPKIRMLISWVQIYCENKQS